MKFKDYLQILKDIARKHPESLEFPIIYAKDEEGNEYQDITYSPCITEMTKEEGEMNINNTSKSFNAILIN